MRMSNVYNVCADANPNANHDSTTIPDPTLTPKLNVNHKPNPNSTHSMTAQIMCNQDL